MKFALDSDRIAAFYPNADMSELEQLLKAFKEICCGNAIDSPISKLDLAQRFRWLTATRSTIVQTSGVHPGLCDDPMDKLNHLHEQLVES